MSSESNKKCQQHDHNASRRNVLPLQSSVAYYSALVQNGHQPANDRHDFFETTAGIKQRGLSRCFCNVQDNFTY